MDKTGYSMCGRGAEVRVIRGFSNILRAGAGLVVSVFSILFLEVRVWVGGGVVPMASCGLCTATFCARALLVKYVGSAIDFLALYIPM